MSRKLISFATPVVTMLLFMSISLLISFAYFGALLNPNGNIHDLPLAIVVEDQGATTPMGQYINVGNQTVQNVLAQHDQRIAWKVVSSRDAVVAGIHKNDYAGAMVIPPDYSATIMQLMLTGGMSGTPAHIEILTNQSTGTLADSTAQTIEKELVGAISQSVHAQALALAQTVTLPTKPDAAAQYVLSDPVKATITPIQPVDAKAAIGLVPMYLSVAMTIIGLLGANISNTSIDIARSLTHRQSKPTILKSRLATWGVKLGLGTIATIFSGLIVTWMTADILGMPVHHFWELALFAMAGIEVNFLITLAFVANMGLSGTLIAVVFTTIFGVPTSGGVYPLQMVPSFFTWLGEWLPMRYMVDGVRSLLYFDGQLGVGLEKALWVLGGYAVGLILAGTSIAIARDLVKKHFDVHLPDWLAESFRSTPQIAVD